MSHSVLPRRRALGLAIGGLTAAGLGTARAVGCPALLNHIGPRLQDEKAQSLCQYAGKVLLIVNTASYCGFTGQFKGLETLNEKYAPRGLVVMGFPSNDFRQEDADARKTAEVCFNTYGVKFPMFAAVKVRGADAHPLFAALAQATGEPEGIGHHASQVAVGLDLEDLGADVGVQAGEPAPAATHQLLQHLLQLVGIETELAVEVAGADVLVGMALDAGGETQHQPHRLVEAGAQLAEQFNVAPVVEHNGDAMAGRQGQLLGAFVVAVQHDPLRCHAPP